MMRIFVSKRLYNTARSIILLSHGILLLILSVLSVKWVRDWIIKYVCLISQLEMKYHTIKYLIVLLIPKIKIAYNVLPDTTLKNHSPMDLDSLFSVTKKYSLADAMLLMNQHSLVLVKSSVLYVMTLLIITRPNLPIIISKRPVFI